MKTILLTVVAAGLLWVSATANAQNLEGLSCSGQLEVSRTDDSLSVLCSGDLEIGGALVMPEGRLSFTAAGQLSLNSVLSAPSVELVAYPFEVRRVGSNSFELLRVGSSLTAWPGGAIGLGGPVVPSIILGPPALVAVSSVPEPQTYALWLAGLAALARIAAARRRNRC